MFLTNSDRTAGCPYTENELRPMTQFTQNSSKCIIDMKEL